MVILALLSLSLGSSFALPTPSEPPINFPPLIFARSADTLGTRSIYSVTWSCLTTIFACTWIAVHPNIPGPNDGEWAVLRRRLAIMGCALIAPEMVIYWAARQHQGARRLAKQYRERGWTMAHGFFIGMGGFTLHDERGKTLRVLELMELRELFEGGKIAWPSITSKEIQDRSKGDYLSKGIVLAQISWFIAQCIARGAYGLAITELEVATIAFAAVTGVTYFLWWHKPIDVRCSVPVYLLPHSNQAHVDSQSPKSEQSQTPLVVVPDSAPNLRETNCTAISGPNFTWIQQFAAFIRREREKYGPFLGLINVFLIMPFFGCWTILLSNFFKMVDSHALDDSSNLRVPTFYAPSLTHDETYIVSIIISVLAVIFGGIHCVAWSFQFPTIQEQGQWRTSAVQVSALPIFFFVFNWRGKILMDYLGKRAMIWIVSALAGSYITARIILLILACIALRALPPSAFVEIQWTSFFPHVG